MGGRIDFPDARPVRPSGWLCPQCGGAHAPDVMTCPNEPPRPLYFEPEHTAGCPACRNGGICMCVRPERQVYC